MAETKKQRFDRIYAENFKISRHVIGTFPSLKNDAEDIIHDVFLKFFRLMDDVPEGKERAYLVTAMRNACCDKLKQAKFRRTDATDIEAPEFVANNQMWVSDDAHEMRLAEVSRIADDLARKEKMGCCFREFYMEGLSLKQIAERHQEPIGTIAARVSRFRDKVKERVRLQMEE